jgi:hypothetical protein
MPRTPQTLLAPSVGEHPLYAELTTAADLRRFMASHVFAVWDFQCLLKALQARLTSVASPWLPTPDLAARRLINEIVLAEESDEHPDRGHASHLELYVDAMDAAGADSGPVLALLEGIRAGHDPRALLAEGSWPPGVARFVTWTLDLIATGELHRIAAAFSYGREEVIPAMFQRLVEQLERQEPERWRLFRFYLERHIELDGDEHGPAAARLVTRTCGDDPVKLLEAQAAGREALVEREALWDAVRAGL